MNSAPAPIETAASRYAIIIALDPIGRAAMKRDMELIRKIVLAIQSQSEPTLRRLKIDGYDDNIVGRHVEMLVEAGYVHGNVHSSSMGTQLTSFVTDLTWDGHDFAGALENETVWARIKQALSPTELASLPLSVARDVAMKLLAAYAMQKVGLGG